MTIEDIIFINTVAYKILNLYMCDKNFIGLWDIHLQYLSFRLPDNVGCYALDYDSEYIKRILVD